MMKIQRAFFFFIAIAAGPGMNHSVLASQNQELDYLSSLKPDIEAGKAAFASCTKCHGTEGWGSYSGEYPQLAGQHASVTLKQLSDIRSGQRDNPLMLPIVAELSKQGDQSLVDVAAYVATLKMNPDPGVGEAEDEELEVSKNVFAEQCATCHGSNGEGDAGKSYPLLQGQNYEYVLRQLKLIQAGKRKNANLDMQKVIAGMTENKLKLMADYISRLEPSEDKLAPFGWSNPDFQ